MNLQHLLVETYAHIPPENAIADLSEESALARVPNTPHSIAEIVAHMSFWQDWLLRRTASAADPMPISAAIGWPAAGLGTWPALRGQFLAGIHRAAEIGTQANLNQPVSPAIEFPPMADYTVADTLAHIAMHNSHHLGQIITLRQCMGLWPPAAGSWTW